MIGSRTSSSEGSIKGDKSSCPCSCTRASGTPSGSGRTSARLGCGRPRPDLPSWELDAGSAASSGSRNQGVGLSGLESPSRVALTRPVVSVGEVCAEERAKVDSKATRRANLGVERHSRVEERRANMIAYSKPANASRNRTRRSQSRCHQRHVGIVDEIASLLPSPMVFRSPSIMQGVSLAKYESRHVTLWQQGALPRRGVLSPQLAWSLFP